MSFDIINLVIKLNNIRLFFNQIILVPLINDTSVSIIMLLEVLINVIKLSVTYRMMMIIH